MSDSAILPSDQYYIRNQETFAGRNHVEDRSLNPKKVYCPTDGDLELWELERLYNGRYKLKTRGAPTGERNNLLYAYLIEQDRAEEWIITKREDDGHRNLYTIQKADGQDGWVKQTNVEDPQIAVRGLIATKSIPPQFHESGLWNIQPLVN